MSEIEEEMVEIDHQNAIKTNGSMTSSHLKRISKIELVSRLMEGVRDKVGQIVTDGELINYCFKMKSRNTVHRQTQLQ